MHVGESANQRGVDSLDIAPEFIEDIPHRLLLLFKPVVPPRLDPGGRNPRPEVFFPFPNVFYL